MKRAIQLARKGHGRVSPNPMVGAVVVRDGKILGEGYHVYEDRDHAEVVALRGAGVSAEGADLYVSLEPCCFRGRTPPCTEKILSSGIRRVAVAAEDPNPKVSGKGIQTLKDHGLEVSVGLCRELAERLNEVFFHFVAHTQPFVTLKLAMTLDGRIATASGNSKWITSEKSRLLVQRMRYDSDAILVGIGTVLADNPSLDVRWGKGNSITKIVLDPFLEILPGARLFESGDPVIVFHSDHADKEKRRTLQDRSKCIEVESCESDLNLGSVLEELGRRSITSLLVEGGSAIATSFLKARTVDKLILFYGPRVIGSEGLPAFGNLQVGDLSEALKIRIQRVRKVGVDFMVEGKPE